MADVFAEMIRVISESGPGSLWTPSKSSMTKEGNREWFGSVFSGDNKCVWEKLLKKGSFSRIEGNKVWLSCVMHPNEGEEGEVN